MYINRNNEIKWYLLRFIVVFFLFDFLDLVFFLLLVDERVLGLDFLELFVLVFRLVILGFVGLRV